MSITFATRALCSISFCQCSNQRTSQCQGYEERESLPIHSLTSQEWQCAADAHKCQSKHIGRQRYTRFDMELGHGGHGDQRRTARDDADRALVTKKMRSNHSSGVPIMLRSHRGLVRLLIRLRKRLPEETLIGRVNFLLHCHNFPNRIVLPDRSSDGRNGHPDQLCP